MPKVIQDEFSKLMVSRQRKYQLRKRKANRCQVCGKPNADGATHCLPHLVAARERARKRKGCKARYKSMSYKLSKSK